MLYTNVYHSQHIIMLYVIILYYSSSSSRIIQGIITTMIDHLATCLYYPSLLVKVAK